MTRMGVRQVTEDEAWTAWLSNDLESPRWQRRLHECLDEQSADQRLVGSSNLSDECERRLRDRVVRCLHLWLEPWPTGVSWSRVDVSVQEIRSWLFLHDRNWLTFTQGTRRVGDLGATWDVQGELRQAGRDLRGDIELMTARLLQGSVPRPLLAVTTGRAGNPTVILDGHVRATAVAGLGRPETVQALVGQSAGFANWRWYGHRKAGPP